MDIFVVTMWREGRGGDSHHHLPTFFVPAFAPSEAITKVRALFPGDLKIGGKVMRGEPHCDREMDF